MNDDSQNIAIPERIDGHLRIALANIAQARSILANSVVAKMLEDAEVACIEAKELNSKIVNSLPHTEIERKMKMLDTSEIEIFSKSIYGKKILILEDEKPVARMLKSLLEKLGCEVTAVDDKDAAVSEYKNSITKNAKFDIVMLDLVVGGSVGGIECFNHLLEIDPNVKAILSSGYCESVAKEIRYKFASILPKPYTYGELIRVIASVSEKKK